MTRLERLIADLDKGLAEEKSAYEMAEEGLAPVRTVQRYATVIRGLRSNQPLEQVAERSGLSPKRVSKVRAILRSFPHTRGLGLSGIPDGLTAQKLAAHQEQMMGLLEELRAQTLGVRPAPSPEFRYTFTLFTGQDSLLTYVGGEDGKVREVRLPSAKGALYGCLKEHLAGDAVFHQAMRELETEAFKLATPQTQAIWMERLWAQTTSARAPRLIRPGEEVTAVISCTAARERLGEVLERIMLRGLLPGRCGCCPPVLD